MNSEQSIYISDYLRLSFNNGYEVIDFSNYEILGDIEYVPREAPEISVSESGYSYSQVKKQQEYFSFNLNYYDYKTRIKFEKVRGYISAGYLLEATINTFTSPMTGWPLESNVPTLAGSTGMVKINAVFDNAVIELPANFSIDRMGRGLGTVKVDVIPVRIFNSIALPVPANSCANLSGSDFLSNWNFAFGTTNDLFSVSITISGSSLVSSIDSYPNAVLINPLGIPVRTLVYAFGAYSPSSSIILTEGTWTIQINSMNVTTTSSDACVYSLTKTYYYVEANLAPTVSGISIAGDLNDEGELIASYSYFDNEADLQDVPGTVEGFYSYTDPGGSVGETLLGTGKNFSLSGALVGKYIRFKTIPAALTGEPLGIEYQSAVYGPIVALQTFAFETDFDPATDGTFDPFVAYTGSGTVKWVFEDGSELVGNSISTTGNGLNGAIQDVLIKVEDLSGITELSLFTDSIVQNFDTSTLPGLTKLDIRANNITGIAFSASQNFTVLHIADNPLLATAGSAFAVPLMTNVSIQMRNTAISGTLSFRTGTTIRSIECANDASITVGDFSNIQFTGTSTSHEVDFGGATGLTSFLQPAISSLMGDLFFTDSLVSTIDYSNIEILDRAQFSRCNNLTTVNHGAQVNKLTQIVGQDCPLLTQAQDFSLFSENPNYLFFNGSPIPGIILAPVAGVMTTGIDASGCNIGYITNLSSCTGISSVNNWGLDLSDNGMTTGEVDTILADILAVSVGGYTGRVIDIDGTNAAPTDLVVITALVDIGFIVNYTV